ncbi:MAG: hypothetical protein ABI678_13460, partial [Kofleriaceae bacterium]
MPGAVSSMRPIPSFLTSPTLTFDREGGRVIAVDADAIAVVDLARSETVRIEQHAARAAIGFADQIWIASQDDRLLRYTPAGSPIGEALVLPFAAPAMFVSAACGPAAALWGDLALHCEGSQLVRAELPGVELALPLTHRRHVIARGSRLILPSGVVTALPQAISGGAVLADGAAVALVLGSGATRQLALAALGTGQILTRVAIPAGALRLATRRGIALALTDPSTLVAFDLRSGRELAKVALDRQVRDLAIDPDGKRVVLRSTHLEILELDELMRWSAANASADDREDVVEAPALATPAAPSVEPEPTFEPIAAESVGLPSAPLLGLAPRSPAVTLPASAITAQLDRELRRVALWTLRAIAVGWDTRRIGYGNEGQHPYELEVAAILGMHEGHATEYVTAAVDRIAEHEASLAADPMWRTAGTPLATLITELDLTERAVDVLLVVAAGALWGEIARLYGILANDVQRATVDELIVHQVLAGRHDRHAIAAELDPRAPLVRLGLVSVSSRRARPFAELSVEPAVLDLLRGIAPELGDATTVRTTDRVASELDVPRATLAHAISQLARPERAARILVRGRTGSGRKTLLASLAAAAGRSLAVIDALGLPRQAEPFQRALRQA